jgi:acylglycerol lipase
MFAFALAFASMLSGCSERFVRAPRNHTHAQRHGDVEAREETFEGRRGLLLFSRSWRSTTQPPRAAIVFVHGIKDHSGRYDDVARRMVGAGFAAYAYDHRGNGRSDGAATYVDRFEDYLADLDTFLARVRQRELNAPVFLFGHSMGGAICTLYVITRQPALQGLVLSAPALHSSESGGRRALARFASALFPFSAVFDPAERDYSRDPAVVRSMELDPYIHHRGVAARSMAELLGAMDEINRSMERVRVPTLIFHGTADRLTLIDGSRALARRAATADRTLVVLPNASHDVLHEPNGDGARAQVEIIRWMNAHLPAQTTATTIAP